MESKFMPPHLAFLQRLTTALLRPKKRRKFDFRIAPSTKMEQTGMGQQASCTGLSMPQPGHPQEDAGEASAEERTPAQVDLSSSGPPADTNLTQQPYNSQLDRDPIPPDLATVVASWNQLPESIRKGIVAMIQAAVPAAAPTCNPSPEHSRAQ